MTEQELIDMGFHKELTDEGSYYYSFKIGDLTLITNQCSDEVVHDTWTVDIFDTGKFIFSSATDLLQLITVLERNIKTKG
jgi:hypothetical protein